MKHISVTVVILYVLHFVNVVQPKIVLIGNKEWNTYNIKCVSSNYSEVLAPAFPLSSATTFSESKSNYKLPLKFKKELYENSASNHLGLVLDDRWESFPIEHTIGEKISHRIYLVKNVTTLGANNNRFGLSILAAYEAHIYICQDVGVFKENYCYWVLLGGWYGARSALRYCSQSNIPKLHGIAPAEPSCEQERDTIAGNPLSSDRWHHFEFSLDVATRQFGVYRNGDSAPYLSTNYSDPSYPITSMTDIIVSSRQEDAYWKFHDYNYVRTSSLKDDFVLEPKNSAICISMFVYVKTSTQILLQITPFQKDEIIKEERYSVNKNKWRKIILTQFNLSDDWNYRIILKNLNNDEEIYLSTVERHLNCFKNEYRYIEFQTRSNIENVGCQSLQNDEIIYLNKSHIASDFSCRNTEFGQECIPCSDVTNNEYCRNNFVCELVHNEKMCYCTKGYYTNFCQEECPFGRFGINCREDCGKCKYNHCNNVNGRCEQNCDGNYVEPFCKDVLNPYLENPPKIVGDCLPSACYIRINPTYKGVNKPTYYKIKYKEIGKSSKETMEFISNDLTKLVYKINNLKINTKYELNVLICTHNDTCYEGDHVPTIIIQTICIVPKQSDISIETTNNSATLLYQTYNSTDLCSHDYYYYEFINVVNNRGTINQTINSQNYIGGLKAFTNYNISVKAYLTEEELFVLSFSTKEAAPGPVYNLTTNVQDTNIYISWEEPRIANGIIRMYSISYQNMGGIYCKSPTIENGIENINVTKREYLLSNLMYYRTYKIVITAYTTERGQNMTKYVYTPPSHQLEKDSFAVQLVNITATRVYLNITTNCNRIASNVTLPATLSCSDKWCENAVIVQMDSSNGYIDNLYANSIYTLTVRVVNVNFNKSLQIFDTNFHTLPDKANKIMFFDYYSKSANMVKFRWIEPYPPTGRLQKIKINYWHQQMTTSVVFDVSEMTKCHIWKNMYCTVVKNLDAGTYYNFKISSQNFETNEFSYATSISDVFTAIEQPQTPNNVIQKWDDLYNLTLEWEHPNRTNGELKLFKIFINQQKFIHLVKQPQLIYRKMFPITQMSDHLNISIISNNAYFDSVSYNITVFMPPPTPVCVYTPTATYLNDRILVDVPFINNLSNKNILYIIVARDNFLFDFKHAKNFLDNYKSFNQTDKVWVAVEDTNLKSNRTYLYRIEDNNIGDSILLNTTIHNHALDVKVCQNIYVYIANKRNNEERHVLYTIDNCNQTTHHITLVIVILLVVIIIAVVIIVFIVKKLPMLITRNRRNVSAYYAAETLSDLRPLTNNMDI